jgi:hypothetical protein
MFTVAGAVPTAIPPLRTPSPSFSEKVTIRGVTVGPSETFVNVTACNNAETAVMVAVSLRLTTSAAPLAPPATVPSAAPR